MARRDIATINLVLKPGDVPKQLKQLENAVRQARRQAEEDKKARRKGIAAGKGRPSTFQLGRRIPIVGGAVSGSARFSSRTNRAFRRARLITGQFKIFTDTAQLALELTGDLIGGIEGILKEELGIEFDFIPTFKKNIAKVAGVIPATLSSLGQIARIESVAEDLGINIPASEIQKAQEDLFAARLTTEEIESLVRGRERAALLEGLAKIIADAVTGD